MAASPPGARVSRRALFLVGLGVALPAILLAGLGIYLTLRIARAVEEESARLAEQMNYSTGGGDSLRLGGEDIKVSGSDMVTVVMLSLLAFLFSTLPAIRTVLNRLDLAICQSMALL